MSCSNVRRAAVELVVGGRHLGVLVMEGGRRAENAAELRPPREQRQWVNWMLECDELETLEIVAEIY